VIGILGPSRMRYGTLISFVDFISMQVGEMLERLL
jgi:transcriptional regulator of heat shock response